MEQQSLKIYAWWIILQKWTGRPLKGTLYYRRSPQDKLSNVKRRVKISGDGNETDLHVICLNSVIKITVEVLKRNVFPNDCDGTEKSVVANYNPFLDDG